MADFRQIKVVFIGGSGRSGSTLLDTILGQVNGVFSLGEMYHIWKRGFIDNQLCGCGSPFHSCRFWQAVIEEASKDIDLSEPQSILDLQRSVGRFRHVPFLFFRSLRSSAFSLRLSRYVDIMHVLYRAIATVSNCRVLIDSSKIAPQGLILNEMAGIELYLLHLIRDSRGVSYSLKKRRYRPEIPEKVRLMPIKGTVRASMLWNFTNTLTYLLSKRIEQHKTITYEALSLHPKSEIREIVGWLGLDEGIEFFMENSVVELNSGHTVSGNPMRFSARGKVHIRPDMEWKNKMPRFRQNLVTFLTLPVLKAFYNFKRGENEITKPE